MGNALALDRSLDSALARLSWLAIVALHLLPGFVTTLVVIALAPFASSAGTPPGLTLVVLSTVIGGSMEFGYLVLQGWRRNGRLSLSGVVVYRDHMPRWQFVVLLAAVLVYALSLSVLLAPMRNLLATHLSGGCRSTCSLTGIHSARASAESFCSGPVHREVLAGEQAHPVRLRQHGLEEGPRDVVLEQPLPVLGEAGVIEGVVLHVHPGTT
jgi:hypothetical protein